MWEKYCLQWKLYIEFVLFLQILLHKIFHDILVCNSAREATLSYLAALLRTNEKRAQIQVDERSLAGDGFMLNVLSIMQFLAVKVRVLYKYVYVCWTIDGIRFYTYCFSDHNTLSYKKNV